MIFESQLRIPAYMDANEDDFERAIHDGDVAVHRLGDLAIFNYTRSAAYYRRWLDNPATSLSRGLVFNVRTGYVVANPFPKFFNLGENIDHEGTCLPLPYDNNMEATVKLDGALGIGFSQDESDLRILWATRGSFNSSQAQVAQDIWNKRYADAWTNLADSLVGGNRYTLLTEIIHPVTRQVVRYPYEDLILIGVRDNYEGTDWDHGQLAWMAQRLGMRCVDLLDITTVRDAKDLIDSLDNNHEGVVLRWNLRGCYYCHNNGHCPVCNGNYYGAFRVKLKGQAYLSLFKIISHMSPRAVANAWVDGTYDTMKSMIPEELTGDIEAEIYELEERYRFILNEALDYFDGSFARYLRERSGYAEWVNGINVSKNIKSCLFAFYDKKEPRIKRQIAESYLMERKYA